MYATIRAGELGGRQLVCKHGMTTHGRSPARPSTDPVQMLTAHHKSLSRCTCRLAGSPAPATRPAVVERKAARPAVPTPRRAPVPERRAAPKPIEDELLALLGAESVRGNHEAFMAVEPALRLARQELGLGRIEPKFYTRLNDDVSRGFMSKDMPGCFWVAIDQSPREMLEAAFHEICHLKQLKDRAPGSKEAHEHEAQMFGSHWGGICATEAYRC